MQIGKLALITLAMFLFSNLSFAENVEICELNPKLFYYSTATQDERLALVEFAVASNEKFNTRTVPLDNVRKVLDIKPEQIQAGYVVKLMQKDCRHILGFYSLKTKAEDLANKKIELQLLFIHPDHTRKGLGTRLLNKAFAHAKKLGMQKMNLYSMPESQGFYAKHGAIQTGTYINLFNPEGDRVVLMDFYLRATR